MQAVSTAMYTLFAIEILALPILLIIWVIRKIQKKPKMKWVKWFWLSFALFLIIGVSTNPSTWCEHEYKLVESKEASCTENGYEKYHCNLCGGDKKETLKKLGHSMVDVRRVEPTDSKDGEYVQRCTRCGYESIKVLSAPKKAGNSKKEQTPKPTEIETEPEEAIVDGWSGDVSDGAQMVLRQIAEDTAKQIAQNPSTVKMSLFSAGYAKNGHLYAVQQEFSCSNLMGVSETHIVKVVCESNEDESKIQPFEVWLDGEVVFSQERKYVDSEG